MENLYDDEMESNKQSWLDQVILDQGADFIKSLNSYNEGILIQPLYTKDDLPEYSHDNTADFLEDFDAEFIEAAEKETTAAPTWYVGEELYMNKDQQLELIVIESLKRGANYLRIHVSENFVWDQVVDQIRKLQFPAYFSFNINGDLLDENIAGLWRERIGVLGDRDRLIQSLEFDPISYWLETGKIENESRSFNALADIFFRISGHLHDCKLIKVDVSVNSFSDKDLIHQLASALAITSEYFDQLTNKNVPIEELIHLMSFRFTVGTDIFFEIAKFRAFKLLWNNLLRSFIADIEFIPNPFIHVIIKDDLSPEDEPHQNLLRITTKTLAAILGGCDAISISGIDKTTRELNDFDKRSATHIQNIFRYETKMDSYREAAKGSFYIESLSAQLAEKAWAEFKNIENEGGFLENWKKNIL